MFRNIITKRAAAVVTALGALLSGVIMLAPSASAAGPFSACRNVYYADGAIKFAVCNDYYTQNPDSTRWKTYQRRVYNPAVGAGGHSDTIGYACDWNNVGGGDCLDHITDSNTEVLFDDIVLGNGSTYWVEVDGSYGASNWCHRVYFNAGGGSSVTGC